MVKKTSRVLPDRYADFRRPFLKAIESALRPGVAILDVGSGARPALVIERRPPDCLYVGLDVSKQELLSCPPGAYDEIVIADIVSRVPELIGKFDLAISWQVLEHVTPLTDALENVRHYLRPNGTFVAHLSGSFAIFALLNRLVPHKVAKLTMAALLRREPASVFPAHYDHCWKSALEVAGRPWSSFDVIPRFVGATYFRFAPPLQKIYLAYENLIAKESVGNLATHYLVVARK